MVTGMDIVRIHKFLSHVIRGSLRCLEYPHRPWSVNHYGVGVHHTDPPVDSFKSWRSRVLPHGFDDFSIWGNVRHYINLPRKEPTRQVV